MWSANSAEDDINLIISVVAELRRRHSRPAFSRNGRYGIDGKTLVNFALDLGVKEIVPPRLRKPAYVTPCAGGYRLAIAVPQRSGVCHIDMVTDCLESDSTLRWMFAHELGHVWLGNAAARQDRVPSLTTPVEAMCQRFAAEVLLPREKVEQVVCEHPQSIVEAILEIARYLGAPVRASIRRAIEELCIIDASVVLVSARVANDWESCRLRYREACLPRAEVEVFSADDDTKNVHAEITKILYDNEVVRLVCCSGLGPASYHTSVFCGETYEFLEGFRLKDFSPIGSALLAFAKVRPPRCITCKPPSSLVLNRTLFD